MKNSRLAILIVALTGVTLVIASTLVVRGFWRAFAKPHFAKSASSVSQPYSSSIHAMASLPNLVPVPKILPVRPAAMAEAFKTRRLPPPMMLNGNPDDIARSLAMQIAGNNDASLPALVTAIQMSGFSIRDTDGKLSVVPKGPSQGLAFDTFTVASMAKLYNDGWSMSLDDLSTVLSKAIPRISKDQFNRILISGITKSVQGDQPVRFWARTIVELGRNAPVPYDLTDPKLDPATAELNSIQVNFILERVAADRIARSRPNAGVHNSRLSAWSPRKHVQLEPAAYHPSASRPLFRLASEESKGFGSPCGETADTVIDGVMVLKSIVFSEVEEEALNMGPLNSIIAILRFISIYAAMDVKITMDNEPLVRTPDGPNLQDAGETRVVTAYVWFDIHDWPCILWILTRGIAATKDIDIESFPKSGPAKGVGVEWHLIKGGVPLGIPSRDPGYLDAVHRAIVMFDNGPGSDGATWNKETDNSGHTSIKVSGRPQLWDMTYEKRFPIRKKMSVLVKIAYKHNGTADKLAGEFLDVLGPAIGLAKGDLLAPLTTAVAETLFRMHWYSSKEYEFPVQDWVVCKEGWGGTVQLNTFFQRSSSNNGVTSNLSYNLGGTLVLSGGEMTSPFEGEAAAHWEGDIVREDDSVNDVQKSNECGPVSIHNEIRAQITGWADGDTKVGVISEPAGETRHYQVALRSAEPRFKTSGTCSNREEYVGSQYGGPVEHECISRSLTTAESKSCDSDQAFPISFVQGSTDPRKPDEIHDTQVTTDPQTGITTQVIVNLMRCGN